MAGLNTDNLNSNHVTVRQFLDKDNYDSNISGLKDFFRAFDEELKATHKKNMSIIKKPKRTVYNNQESTLYTFDLDNIIYEKENEMFFFLDQAPIIKDKEKDVREDIRQEAGLILAAYLDMANHLSTNTFERYEDYVFLVPEDIQPYILDVLSGATPDLYFSDYLKNMEKKSIDSAVDKSNSKKLTLTNPDVPVVKSDEKDLVTIQNKGFATVLVLSIIFSVALLLIPLLLLFVKEIF